MALAEVVRPANRCNPAKRDPPRTAPGADCPAAHRVWMEEQGGGSGGCPASSNSLEMLSILTAPKVWGVTRLTTRRE